MRGAGLAVLAVQQPGHERESAVAALPLLYRRPVPPPSCRVHAVFMPPHPLHPPPPPASPGGAPAEDQLPHAHHRHAAAGEGWLGVLAGGRVCCAGWLERRPTAPEPLDQAARPPACFLAVALLPTRSPTHPPAPSRTTCTSCGRCSTSCCPRSSPPVGRLALRRAVPSWCCAILVL